MMLNFNQCLTLLFVYLKVAYGLEWSWWLVFLPLNIDLLLKAIIWMKKVL